MISEATEMLKASSRAKPFWRPPRPMTISRRARSFMSMTRRQAMRRVSMPRRLPCWIWLSIIAASRLLAVVTAWMSPVKCRSISSAGSTCEAPPPVAPPFMPNTGPSEGSRRVAIERTPMRFRAIDRPMAMVVLPSPAGVGVVAVTSTWRPSGTSPGAELRWQQPRRFASDGSSLAL